MDSKRPQSEYPRRKQLTTEEYVTRILQGNRAALGRAISLVESTRSDHQTQAQEILSRVIAKTGNSIRIGISGVPGAGKSTFIEQFGKNLTSKGHRVAVLAIDPSSQRSGGSVLGDKTRMNELAVDPAAFIRPSPTGTHLGGVARKTREAMLLCEAAGFDVIIIETVGVGQSEIAVVEMVDFFLVLMLSGAGDELQGMKRGILEVADLIAINKADGERQRDAERTRRELASVLHFFQPKHTDWQPEVATCSALENTGLEQIWLKIVEFADKRKAAGSFENLRQQQLISWMWKMVDDELLAYVHQTPKICDLGKKLERELITGRVSPTRAARQILELTGIEWKSGSFAT